MFFLFERFFLLFELCETKCGTCTSEQVYCQSYIFLSATPESGSCIGFDEVLQVIAAQVSSINMHSRHFFDLILITGVILTIMMTPTHVCVLPLITSPELKSHFGTEALLYDSVDT